MNMAKIAVSHSGSEARALRGGLGVMVFDSEV